MTKMYLSTLMQNCDHTICLALSIPFYMAQPYKAWLFEKFIFELEAIYSSKSLIASFALSKSNKTFRSSQTHSWTPYFPMLSFFQRLVFVSGLFTPFLSVFFLSQEELSLIVLPLILLLNVTIPFALLYQFFFTRLIRLGFLKNLSLS